MSVNNVSAVSDALKYINGMEVEDKKTSLTTDIKDSIFNPITIGFGALEVSSSLKSTMGTKKLKDAIIEAKNIGNVAKGSFVEGSTALRSTNLGEQWTNTIKNIYKKAEEKTAAKKAAKTALTVVDDGAKAANKTGIFSKIGSFFSKGRAAIKGGLSKIGKAISSSSLGKAVSSGISKIGKTGVGKFLGNVGSKVGKLFKGTGAAGMMIFDGVISLFTEVVPAFAQGGVESGFKQIGKSALKVAGTGLGWAGGTAAATAIGAAIGSIFPGVGTVIGGAIGQFVGGMLGSTIGSGIANKITGKSEVEKLQDKQFDETAAQVQMDTNAMNELQALVATQVQAEIADGTADSDTEKMAAYLNSGAFNTASYSTVVSNPYNVNYDDTTVQKDATATKTSTFNSNYWSEAAGKIASGDTSIYDISNERLEGVFTSSNNSTSTDSVLVDTEDENINYFAIG